MWLVVKNDNKNETCYVLYENESYVECEFFVDELKHKVDIEICEKY